MCCGDEMKQERILIGVPTQEMARNASFYDYLDLLEKPEGTIITRSHGQSPARNRNLIIEKALELNVDRIMFFDDDVAFKPDTLTRLMKHDVDAVTGLYFMRNFPHQPIMFDLASPDGKCCYHYLSPGERGLVPIVNAGLGCCLIKTEVFRKMEQPWIRLGELERDHWSDDIGFFVRFARYGFKLFCDLEVPVGHFGQVLIWPNRTPDGTWLTSYDTSGPEMVSVRQFNPHLIEQTA